MKKLMILLVGAALITSCNKTYECIDQTGTITGEVKAPNAEKAKSRCPGNGTIKEK